MLKNIPNKKIGIIDYEAGNIMSVTKAFQYLGCEIVHIREEKQLNGVQSVVLPGVGAFGDAYNSLTRFGLADSLKSLLNNNKLPFLGICLGMQLLFQSSEESPNIKGLCVLEGTFKKFKEKNTLKVPEIGYNYLRLNPKNKNRLYKGIPYEDLYVYFIHSYYLVDKGQEFASTYTEYGFDNHGIDPGAFISSVESHNIFGCQFHPEKSGKIGLQILENFIHI